MYHKGLKREKLICGASIISKHMSSAPTMPATCSWSTFGWSAVLWWGTKSVNSVTLIGEIFVPEGRKQKNNEQ